MTNQELFDYMKNEHDVTLLVGDMHEIERIVNKAMANGIKIAVKTIMEEVNRTKELSYSTCHNAIALAMSKQIEDIGYAYKTESKIINKFKDFFFATAYHGDCPEHNIEEKYLKEIIKFIKELEN